MRLVNKNVERKGDQLKVSALFKDHMRRPVVVRATTERGEGSALNSCVMEGSVRDVTGTMYSLAEIAWSMGWRPKGLAGTLARVVETYKEPAE
jgi:hypothetical protein